MVFFIACVNLFLCGYKHRFVGVTHSIFLIVCMITKLYTFAQYSTHERFCNNLDYELPSCLITHRVCNQLLIAVLET